MSARNEVRVWLEGNGLGEYWTNFEDDDWDALDIVKGMEESDILALGIRHKGHLEDLRVALDNLKKGIGSAEEQMTIPSKEERAKVFRKMDNNGNGTLSLAEIDKAVIALWPSFNQKPALMRAYKAADVDGNGFVNRKEFRLLLEYLIYFNKIWDKFDEIDTSDDRKLDMDEFKKGCKILGETISGSEAEKEFKGMDKNGGGSVLFDEFCVWIAKRQVGGVKKVSGPTAEQRKATRDSAKKKKAAKGGSTPGGRGTPKGGRGTPKGRRGAPGAKNGGRTDAADAPTAEDTAALSMPDKATRMAAFKKMDFNGNGALSLAEIDKAVLALYPSFNHKPALMRAYKAADKTGDGFIGRKEFRLLLEYLIYFNNLWAKFEEIDSTDDRRIEIDEFKRGCALLGESMSDAEAEAVFGKMDDNGGGFVLFDEFCTWISAKQLGGKAMNADELMTAMRKAMKNKEEQFNHTESDTKMIFDLMDKDGSGALDKREFREACKSLGLIACEAQKQGLDESHIESLWDLFDADNSGTIAYGEVQAILHP